MGGAVALLLHRKHPSFYHGAVLVAPMCKISEKVKPHPVVINILTQMEHIIPKWKIVPSKDVIDSAFKDPIKREEIRRNKLIYQDKPRLKTALELLRTSMILEGSLSQVNIPFLVLHGEADTVTDPEVSRALYDRAWLDERAHHRIKEAGLAEDGMVAVDGGRERRPMRQGRFRLCGSKGRPHHHSSM